MEEWNAVQPVVDSSITVLKSHVNNHHLIALVQLQTAHQVATDNSFSVTQIHDDSINVHQTSWMEITFSKSLLEIVDAKLISTTQNKYVFILLIGVRTATQLQTHHQHQ
jgi:hypothetical protein